MKYMYNLRIQLCVARLKFESHSLTLAINSLEDATCVMCVYVVHFELFVFLF